MTTKQLTRRDVERIVEDDRAAHLSTNLSANDMSGIDLRNLDLQGVVFRGADLTGADFRDSDLTGANFRGANMTTVNASGANFTRANLVDVNFSWGYLQHGANLTEADFSGADLRGTIMHGANLSYTNFDCAALSGVYWDGITLDAGPSGRGDFRPTPGGWRVSIGCWKHRTLDDLADLILDNVEWPEARGEEKERRRPFLVAAMATCEAHMAYSNK